VRWKKIGQKKLVKLGQKDYGQKAMTVDPKSVPKLRPFSAFYRRPSPLKTCKAIKHCLTDRS
jgi:hypothetical protein